MRNVTFTTDELVLLLAGAKMLQGYYEDVAETSGAPSEWDEEVDDARRLVEKMEGLQ